MAQNDPELNRATRDRIGGTLVINLSETVTEQSKLQGVDPVLINSVIRHESGALERRMSGPFANAVEFSEAIIRGGDASIGIGQVKLYRAKELEEMGYVSPRSSNLDRTLSLLNPKQSVEYITGMLHYLSDQLNPLPGFSRLSKESQSRIILIGYNLGWDALKNEINQNNYKDTIDYWHYDDQTYDEFQRWLQKRAVK